MRFMHYVVCGSFPFAIRKRLMHHDIGTVGLQAYKLEINKQQLKVTNGVITTTPH